jgi:hypothetical protein
VNALPAVESIEALMEVPTAEMVLLAEIVSFAFTRQSTKAFCSVALLQVLKTYPLAELLIPLRGGRIDRATTANLVTIIFDRQPRARMFLRLDCFDDFTSGPKAVGDPSEIGAHDTVHQHPFFRRLCHESLILQRDDDLLRGADIRPRTEVVRREIPVCRRDAYIEGETQSENQVRLSGIVLTDDASDLVRDWDIEMDEVAKPSNDNPTKVHRNLISFADSTARTTSGQFSRRVMIGPFTEVNV